MQARDQRGTVASGGDVAQDKAAGEVVVDVVEVPAVVRQQLGPGELGCSGI